MSISIATAFTPNNHNSSNLIDTKPMRGLGQDLYLLVSNNGIFFVFLGAAAVRPKLETSLLTQLFPANTHHRGCL